MTDKQKQEIMRRYNEGMCNMSDAQMAIRAAEQAEDMRNAYHATISSEMLAQASMNFWRQEGPFTPAPIQMPPPTMWERLKRWVLA